MSQARIAESAIKKAEEAGPDQQVKFVIRYDGVLLPPEEVAHLRSMGMELFMPFVRQAFISLPARRLLELAELPSITAIF